MQHHLSKYMLIIPLIRIRFSDNEMFATLISRRGVYKEKRFRFGTNYYETRWCVTCRGDLTRSYSTCESVIY